MQKVMQKAKSSNHDRIQERLNRPNKFEVRRIEIAENALGALKDYGYAQTTLRDIAKHAGVSLSSLHYYFADRGELMSYCIRNYKRQFIEEINIAIDNSNDLTELRDQVIDIFVKAVVLDTKSHRLWYDIRAQAMYGEKLDIVRRDIEQSIQDVITKVMVKAEELSEQEIPLSADQFYWVLDGMFRHHLGLQLNGDSNAGSAFKNAMLSFFEGLFSH